MSPNNASNRPPKRARKKQARDDRREQWRRAVQKRRRQRWGVLLGSLAVIGVGVAIAYFAFGPKETKKTPLASDEPSASDTIKTPAHEPVACDAKLPKSAGSAKKQYSKPKDQQLDEDATYIWHLETSCGDIDVELNVKDSPKTSNSVVFLTREKFYDGTFFHRVLTDFVIQGGDPQGTGIGGPGYDVVEAPADDVKYEEGTVAMAKGGSDPDGTSGSQFYIVSGKEGESLPPQYALLGTVVEGQDVVEEIEKLGGSTEGPPSAYAYIERATIEEK